MTLTVTWPAIVCCLLAFVIHRLTRPDEDEPHAGAIGFDTGTAGGELEEE